MTTDSDRLIVVNSRDEIPADLTTEEYAQFWETHSIGPGLIEEGKSDPEVQALAARLRGGKERE
jgi:hypothetical protein